MCTSDDNMISTSTEKPTGFSESNPFVTVVIPTYNSGEALERCACSIDRQTYSNLEVIVVDNYSTDKTAMIAESHGFRVLRLRGNRMIARAYGVRNASGEYILFVDSDQVLDRECVDRLAQRSLESDVDALVLFELSNGSSRWHRLLTREAMIEFELKEGLPRWFRREAMVDFSAAPYSGEIHVHGEDRLLLAWLRDQGRVISEARDAIIFHDDPPFDVFLKKRFRNTFTGTRGDLLKEYADVALPSAIRLFNPALIYRSTRSITATLTHYFLQSASALFQTAGTVAARLV